ncbi:MAG: hypothetical protein DI598_11785 [Pseudopedobacter saltans]|uniref:Glycosyl transferase family 9 n=1 Tax=Pseudopedobacter saltans TaxID=151895 RepID=A0A2W5EZC8_9SPHI|nr:MAG: hypothetical protein DI598_11785 [Pseudopedobacter saltans]
MIKRIVSLFIRKRKLQSNAKKLVHFVEIVRKEIAQLPIKRANSDTLLLVRPDEIGDYILCRHVLPIIRNSEKYRNKKIIYVGNKNYKDIAETLDKDYIDTFIWIDKPKFKNDASYRISILETIRATAPSVTIELQRTSDLDYGDLIVEASNAPIKYANSNYYKVDYLNKLSSEFYTNIYSKSWDNTHEFYFNQQYINWVCNTNMYFKKPEIDTTLLPKSIITSNYILCVIGSSKKSKNWPIKYWITLLKNLHNNYKNVQLVLLGGPGEQSKAEIIIQSLRDLDITSFVGKTTLLEALSIIQHAQLMISNDTFAIHARVALGNSPTVVMANGESAFRFSDLQDFSSNYKVLYAKPYEKRLPKMSNKDKWSYIVPSVDMQSIQPSVVLKTCISLYKRSQ